MDYRQKPTLFSEFPPISTETWEERIKADLKGADYHKKLIWKTDEGFEVRPYYRAEDLDGLEYLAALPGFPPYTRGQRSSGNSWAIREEIVEDNIGQANARAREAVAKGADAIGINAKQVSTHKQMGELLSGIDLEKIAVNFTASQSYPLTLELFIYELAHQNLQTAHVKGSLNCDPVSYLLMHGNYYGNWKQNLEETGYLLETINSKIPQFKVVTVNGHRFQNAGSTLVQELAFSLASANEYLSGMTDKGFAVDAVAPYMQLSFAAGPNYFMEIAKLRAARILWALLVEQYKPSSAKSSEVFIHVTTALWNKAIFDPYVNMLRTTTEGMSAILGNADSVTVLPFNISYQPANDLSVRVSRNQQLILKEESYFDKIVDPSGGAYYIENLTDSIANRAWDLFREVESKGGMLACIHEGFVQDEIAKSRQKKEEDIAQRRMILLGTNQYPNPQELMTDEVSLPDKGEEPVDTQYKKLLPYRAAQPFEEIRLATERHVKSGNKRPSVFLFTMGNLAMLRARAGFAANFFGCAGYHIIDNAGFSNVEEGIEKLMATPCEIVVICSSDEEYPEIVPAIAAGISKTGTEPRLVVAGYPKEYLETFRQAGIDDFIHVRSDLLSTLRSYQQYSGIA